MNVTVDSVHCLLQKEMERMKTELNSSGKKKKKQKEQKGLVKCTTMNTGNEMKVLGFQLLTWRVHLLFSHSQKEETYCFSLPIRVS